MMKGNKDRKGYAEGGMATKNGPDRGNKRKSKSNGDSKSNGGGYTTYADKTKATPAKPA